MRENKTKKEGKERDREGAHTRQKSQIGKHVVVAVAAAIAAAAAAAAAIENRIRNQPQMKPRQNDPHRFCPFLPLPFFFVPAVQCSADDYLFSISYSVSSSLFWWCW